VEVIQAWSRRDLEVMQAGRSGGAVAWKEITSSGGGRRVWRRSKVESTIGGKHEALETVGSGGGRKLWRRSKARRQQARSFGGGRKLWKWSKSLE
jgi:hypothetical protein